MSQPNENTKATIGAMSHEQLLMLIEAMRKPVKSEKDIRDEEQAAADRKQMGEILEQARRNKLEDQKNCSHMRANGSTTAVWTGHPINKLYCQACSAWIGNEQPELFNRLYQLAF
jgi:hypothetical protein